MIQDPVEIVSALFRFGVFELWIIGPDLGANGRRGGEIQRRTFHFLHFACRYQELIDWGESVGVDQCDRIEHGAGAGTRQVEVSVIGQINDRLLVGHRGILDSEFILRMDGVTHGYRQVTGKTHFAVRREIRQFDSDRV